MSDTLFILEVQTSSRSVERLVAVNGATEEEAKQKFENEYEGYEVGVTVLPYEGETTEVVFASNKEIAREIATGRDGEYSDVSRNVNKLGIDVTVNDVTPYEEYVSLDADFAKDEYEVAEFMKQ